MCGVEGVVLGGGVWGEILGDSNISVEGGVMIFDDVVVGDCEFDLLCIVGSWEEGYGDVCFC